MLPMMGVSKGIKIFAASAVLVASGIILYWAYSFDRALGNAPFFNGFHPTTQTLIMRGLVGLAGICAGAFLLKTLVSRSR